jgi:hypothetical protein
VVVGGIGTLLVVPLIALAWPEARRLGRITLNPEPAPAIVEATAQVADR